MLWADRMESRRPWATTRLPSCPMPIASDLTMRWCDVAVQALPAVPQHCHPRARVPVPGCSEVSQPGLLSCLMGCKVILDQGVDDESVCGRCDGSDWKAAGAASGCRRS